MLQHETMMDCPCGLPFSFQDCCAQVIQQDQACSPERLMRSRYSAYVVQDVTYLHTSWHSSTRPESIRLHPVEWLKLTVLHADTASVTFHAFFKEGGKHKLLHEKSSFAQEQGKWRYVEGKCRIDTVRRNDVCPCGRAKKYKHCCAKGT